MKKLSVLMLCLSIVSTLCAGEIVSNKGKEVSATTKSSTQKGELKIYSFHAAKRCYTCNKIEELTKEVVKELANDRIKLEVINISEKSNEALADKYEVAWSSLILDNGKSVNNLTKMGFSTAKNEPEKFKQNLKAEIAKML